MLRIVLQTLVGCAAAISPAQTGAFSPTPMLTGVASPTLVVTGGPCSGKTSVLAALPARFGDTNIIVVPEAATLYHARGGVLPFGAADDGSKLERCQLWEAWLIELKISLENGAHAQARWCERSVVVCDRGVLDSRAYFSSDAAWQSVLALGSWDESELLGRYDAVLHLAVAPSECYDRASNAARTEDYEQATLAGAGCEAAWREACERHHPRAPRLRSVPNPPASHLEAAFATKLESAVAALRIEAEFAESDQARRDRPALRDRGVMPTGYIIKHAHAVATALDLEDVYGSSLRALRRVQAARRDRRPGVLQLPTASPARRRRRLSFAPAQRPTRRVLDKPPLDKDELLSV